MISLVWDAINNNMNYMIRQRCHEATLINFQLLSGENAMRAIYNVDLHAYVTKLLFKMKEKEFFFSFLFFSKKNEISAENGKKTQTL